MATMKRKNGRFLEIRREKKRRSKTNNRERARKKSINWKKKMKILEYQHRIFEIPKAIECE